MKCSNCGAEIAPDAKFCEVCGQKTEEILQTEAATEPVAGKPKKKRKLKIAIIAVIVVAVAAVSGVWAYGFVRKALMSPTEYYQYVEKKNRDKSKETILGYYGVLRQNITSDNLKQTSKIKVRISDTAKSLLTLAGVDMSKIDDVALDVVANKKGSASATQMQIQLNDESLATLKMYIDLDKKEMFAQIPELTESYLDGSSSLEEASSEEGFEEMKKLYEPQNYFPQTAQLDSILTRYTDLAIEQAKDVKRTEKEIKVDKISQKVDEYTVNVKGKDGIRLCKDILKQAKDDKDIKSIVENFSEDVYSGYEDGVADAMNALEGEQGDDTEVFTLKTYVANDVIVGRELEIQEEDFVIKSLCPQDGAKFGYELSVVADGTTYAVVTGNGSRKSDAVNADFALDLDDTLAADELGLASGKNVVKVKVEDCDMSNIDKGESKGCYTLSTDAVPQLANYSIRIQSEGNMTKAKSTISVMAGKDEMAAIDITSSEGGALKDVKPSNNDTVYDMSDEADMTAYGSEIAIETYLQKLKDKTGIDFEEMANSILGSYALQSAGDDDSLYGSDSYSEDSYSEDSYSEDGLNYDDFDY